MKRLVLFVAVALLVVPMAAAHAAHAAPSGTIAVAASSSLVDGGHVEFDTTISGLRAKQYATIIMECRASDGSVVFSTAIPPGDSAGPLVGGTTCTAGLYAVLNIGGRGSGEVLVDSVVFDVV